MDHAYSSAALFIKIAPAASRPQLVAKAGKTKTSETSPGARRNACAPPVVDRVTITRSSGDSRAIREWEDKKRAKIRTLIDKSEVGQTSQNPVTERSWSTESDDTMMDTEPGARDAATQTVFLAIMDEGKSMEEEDKRGERNEMVG